MSKTLSKSGSIEARNRLNSGPSVGAKPSAPQDWGLYIGGIREAEDLESLRAHGICAVVNAAPDVVHAACVQEEVHASVVFSSIFPSHALACRFD